MLEPKWLEPKWLVVLTANLEGSEAGGSQVTASLQFAQGGWDSPALSGSGAGPIE